MFDKATYVNRRAKLKELVKSGLIIFSETTSRLAIVLPTDTHLSAKTHPSFIISD